MAKEKTSKKVVDDVAWALANWPRIRRALGAGLASALTQYEPVNLIGPVPRKKAKKKSRL